MVSTRLCGPATRGWAAMAVAMLSAAVAGCSSRAEAPRTPPPPTVTVVEARRMTVPVMAEPIGTTRSLQEVSVRARVRGFLKEMLFKEGTDVKKDQLLFVIDEEPFKAKLADAQASLEQAEAALKKARDSKAREVAQAQLALGQAMLALSEVEERREQQLFARKASSTEDVQRKQALRQKDTAQVEAYKASLDQAKADYDTAIAAAQADVAGAKARVTDAQIDLSYCRMTSPIDGRIGLAKVKVGNLVGPSGVGGPEYTELGVVRQLNPMGVDLQVSSRYLDWVTRLIAQGLPVTVFRPGLEGEAARRASGKATVIDNTIDPTTSTFKVQAEVDNPDQSILPGEYVKVDVKMGEVKDAVVVPEQAVVETQAGPRVYVVDDQAKVAILSVKASRTYEGLRVLESGIEPGQRVIVEGLQLVRAGMTVKVETAPPDPALGTTSSSTATPPSTPAPAAKAQGAAEPNAKAAEPGPKS